MLFNAETLQGIVFWIMGSLVTQGWMHVKILLPFAVLGSFFILFHARNLNVILQGEEMAQYLGVEVERVKKGLFLISSLVVGASVAVSGVIGFVGLIVPHAVRLVVGPDHRVLLPSAVLTGGMFLVLCDALARTAAAPKEIPVGIITALMGAPFFIYLLTKNRGNFY
ncbi:MAG: iron chelate uptake ABC transporter family permease subunit [Clostridia bacterium]|nr:iron chelate uptake ABC transporter family permease subunit [Clostridia bacterium]